MPPESERSDAALKAELYRNTTYGGGISRRLGEVSIQPTYRAANADDTEPLPNHEVPADTGALMVDTTDIKSLGVEHETPTPDAIDQPPIT